MEINRDENLDAYITKLGGGFTRSHQYFRIAVHLRYQGFTGLMSELCHQVALITGKSQAAVEKGIARTAQDIWKCPDCARLLEDLERTSMDYPGPEELIGCIVQAYRRQGQKTPLPKEKAAGKQSPFVVSRFYGIVIKMFPRTRCRDLPPHLHAVYRGLVGMISLDRPEMLEGDLPPCALKLALAWVEKRRDELMEVWESEECKTIPPLE